MRKKHTISCPNCGSQIIHRTDLLLKEKLTAYLVPTVMFKCQPCGCRFAHRGNPFARQTRRRFLFLLILTVVFLLSLIIIFLTGGGGKTQKSGAAGGKEQKIAVSTPPPVSTPVPVRESAKMPIKTITLGANRIFGVNWEYNGRGLEITRLSPGPLQRAGLRIGDILVSVDGNTLNDESVILRMRDEIFTGARKEAFIEVLRGDEKLAYRLIK